MENSDNKPESVVMSIALEMKHSIVTLAGPRQHCDTKESMINRAARRARISFRQAKAFYYGEARNPRASIVEQVREALAGHSHQNEGLMRHAARLESAAQALEAIDPDFHRASIDQLRNAALDIRHAALGAGRPALLNSGRAAE